MRSDCAVISFADPGKQKRFFLRQSERYREAVLWHRIPFPQGIDDAVAARLDLSLRKRGQQGIARIVGEVKSFQGDCLFRGIVELDIVLIDSGFPLLRTGIDGTDFIDAQGKGGICIKAVLVFPDKEEEKHQKKSRCEKGYREKSVPSD